VIAKNYRTEFELTQLGPMASAYIDFWEMTAIRDIPTSTMADWEIRFNRFIGIEISTVQAPGH